MMKICVISNTPLFGKEVMIVAGGDIVFASQREFLAKSSLLFRLANASSDGGGLCSVPGVVCVVNEDTREIRKNVIGWDLQFFLSKIPRPQNPQDLKIWKRQVLGAMLLFGSIVRDFTINFLGVSLDELTEADRCLGQQGYLPPPLPRGRRFSAIELDAKARRFAQPNIYQIQR